MLEFELHKAGF